MYPKLFTIGPIPIYSFGLMMGLGFFLASIILHKEVLRKGLLEDFSRELTQFLRIAFTIITISFAGSFLIEYGLTGVVQHFEEQTLKTVIIVAAIIGLSIFFKYKLPQFVVADTTAFIIVIGIIAGVSGCKILYLIENISEVAIRPFDMIFSPGGLTWYGGFILTTLILFYFFKKRGINFLTICDAASPALLLGYGVARIGCHLAGDGDYGKPTNLPWAMSYTNGTYPPSVAFRDFPEIVSKYGVNGVVPNSIPVHPAPLYEFLAGMVMFLILWSLRKRISVAGKAFMLYLIMSGSARLAIEFIRLNPRILFGLTEAQILASIIIILGIIGFFLLKPSREKDIASISHE